MNVCRGYLAFVIPLWQVELGGGVDLTKEVSGEVGLPEDVGYDGELWGRGWDERDKGGRQFQDSFVDWFLIWSIAYFVTDFVYPSSPMSIHRFNLLPFLFSSMKTLPLITRCVGVGSYMIFWCEFRHDFIF